MVCHHVRPYGVGAFSCEGSATAFAPVRRLEEFVAGRASAETRLGSPARLPLEFGGEVTQVRGEGSGVRLLIGVRNPPLPWSRGFELFDLADPFAIASCVDDVREPILVLSTEPDEPDARTAVSFATAAQPDCLIAQRSHPVGLLALLNAADVTARSALPPALAIHFLDLVLEQTWSAVWMPSVARLSHPQPRLYQHVLSWMPVGTSFIAFQHPVSGVRTARALLSHGCPWPNDPVARELLVAGQVPEPIEETMSKASGIASSRQVESFPDQRARYGDGQAVEIVAAPLSPERLEPTAGGSCPSCGIELSTRLCPFCGVVDVDAEEARR